MSNLSPALEQLLEQLLAMSHLYPDPSLKSGNDLIRAYESGERNFRGINLQGFKLLRNLDLSDIDLSQANLNSVDLTGTNLSGVNLTDAQLSRARLNQANLSGANLQGAILSHATLVSANLTHANLSGTNLDGANLAGCTMPNGTVDPSYERVMNAIGHLKQSAWKPITQEGDGDRKSSKFGGMPWLNADESYPSCPCCHKPLRFFFQLNLQDLPENLNQRFGSGILQLFHCTNETVLYSDHPTEDGVGWEILPGMDDRYIGFRICDDPRTFSPCKLVRIIQPSEFPAEFQTPVIDDYRYILREGEFPPKVITDWQEIDSYPSPYDIEEQGIQLTLDDLDFVREIRFYPECDRLSGWTYWIQRDERPECRICHQPMEHLILTLESDDNIPFLWGDCGVGNVFQCSDHLEEVAFLYQE